MNIEKEISEIKSLLLKQEKESIRERKREALTDGIQVVAVILVFFFGIVTFSDLKNKIIK